MAAQVTGDLEGPKRLNSVELDENTSPDIIDGGIERDQPFTVFGNDVPKIDEEPPNEITFEKEGSFSVVRRKMSRVVRNVTIEPVLLFLSFVGSMDGVSMGQVMIDKSCVNDFDFPNGTCDLGVLTDGNHSAENNAVQNEISQFKVYQSIVSHVFPIICSFYLGSWSDTFGRKWLLYLYFFANVVEGSMMLLNVYFLEWPKEYLLFSVNLPTALVGGHLAFYMGVNAFISDISPPHQRSFRMAMVSLAGRVGSPAGTKMGTWLYARGGYVCVFGATLLGRLAGAIFLVIRLEMFNWTPKIQDDAPEVNPIKRKTFSLMHIKDSISTATKKRDNNKRFYLLMYFTVFMFIIVSFFGEHVMSYNYVRTRYGWEVADYGDYYSIASLVDIVGQMILIPLLGYMQITDSIIAPVIISTIVIRHIIKGFAVEPWMLYVASGVDLMGGYSMSACRSLISQCVTSHELGKIFALVSSVESLVPIAIEQAYATVWKATGDLGDPWIGTCYFISACLTSVGLVLSIIAVCRLKGKNISDLDSTKEIKPSYRKREELGKQTSTEKNEMENKKPELNNVHEDD